MEPVIGMEVHCRAVDRERDVLRFPDDVRCGAENAQVCPICLGLPGTLPVPNRLAVEFVVRGAGAQLRYLATGIFYRKDYYYPDLPRLTRSRSMATTHWPQRLHRIEVDGRVEAHRHPALPSGGEDTGKLFHVSPHTSEIDYNHSGMPLMGGSSPEPDISSAGKRVPTRGASSYP